MNRVRSVTHKHLQKMYENTFDKIFNQQIGMYLSKDIFNRKSVNIVSLIQFRIFLKKKKKLNQIIVYHR